MQTQITCPNCRTPYAAQVFNMIDAQRTPELKQMLLQGQLNVGVCPSCRTPTQISAPMAYHDSEHDLFMTFIPMELNLSMAEQERIVGQMTQAITREIPKENFRSYLLRPQTILTQQTFLEKVFETEGITPEMLQRQREQTRLLSKLAQTDSTTQNQIIENEIDLIDDIFVAMLATNLQALEQDPNGNQTFIKLANLQAKIMTETEVGRKIEAEQTAIRTFQKEAQTAGGLTFDLFVDHLVANIDSDHVVDTITQIGQQALRYELFAYLTQRIESTEDATEQNKLRELHARLLSQYEALQAEAKQIMDASQGVLNQFLQADNLEAVIKENAAQIDETFMMFLSAQIQQAESQQDSMRAFELKRVYDAISAEAERQMPPELKFINDLLRKENLIEQKAMIDEINPEEKEQYSALLQIMGAELVRTNPDLAERVQQLQDLLRES